MLLQTLIWRGAPILGLFAQWEAVAPAPVPPPPVSPPPVSPPIVARPSPLPALRESIPKGPSTIMDAVLSAPDLTTLMTTIMKTGVAATLSGPGPMTLFAPSNAAFDRLPASARTALMDPANITILTRVLHHHVIMGALSAEALTAQIKAGGGSTKLVMMSGDSITASMDNTSIILTDSAGNESRVTKSDQREANGIVHIVDSLLLPQPKK